MTGLCLLLVFKLEAGNTHFTDQGSCTSRALNPPLLTYKHALRNFM